MKRVLLIVCCLIGMSFSCYAESDNKASFAEREDVKAYIDDLSKTQHFNKTELTTLFNSVTIHPAVLPQIQKPYEATSWDNYQRTFLTPQRIDAGVAFWKAHEPALHRAETEYGVPPEIILGILGVETKFGQRTGDFRVLNALSDLAFNFPRRQAFFKQELTEFLLLCRELHLDPKAIKGSYAGAIGYPQFMPSSYRRYSVSANKPGLGDLVKSPDDAILSIANYFHKNGWLSGHPVAQPTHISTRYYESHHGNGYKPVLPIPILLHDTSVRIPNIDEPSVVLLQLTVQNNPVYYIGFNNFYVITRYNSSQNYAMAVFELGKLIADEYHRSIPT